MEMAYMSVNIDDVEVNTLLSSTLAIRKWTGIDLSRFRNQKLHRFWLCTEIEWFERTVKNPDRLFFHCPYFKTEKWHCNFFAWLDDYVFSCGEDANKVVSNRLEGHSYVVDNKVNELEERLIRLEDQLEKCRLKMGENRCIKYGFNLLAFLGGVVIASLFRASM
ncbi:hypothetical protein Ahy_B08g091502 [Arachis hypogaea]|uniref:Zinc finger GRF-type domain-containing protein n=1 Tax=Arachis hypogaea TaxID=3818 RepID=A0A444Y279_ARAHY|nr:hypothetical protein Ahy_B08g091502 [Arachis hypogaea]